MLSPTYTNYSSDYPSSAGDKGGIILSPDLSSTGKPKKHAIRDAGMAADVVKTVIQAGRSRSIVNSRILAKINAERPYDSCKLEAEGLGWKQNFTTKPLPSLVEKVAPRFVEVINSLKYLTNASLSDKWENATEKTEKFRTVITNTIRKRKGWKALLGDIAFTNTIFGSVVVAKLDEFGWFPTAFKVDEAFLNDGVKQEARLCQVAVLKEVLLPHELYDQIKDREAAEDVGWNLKNTIDAINNASPQQIRDRLNVGGTTEFWYQNAVRELTLGASYMAGASVVVIYNLLVQEVTGKVTHYKLAGDSLYEIFCMEDRFPSMEDVMTFFSYQKGNGTMYGSKGLGRDLYEMAGMIDRTRNEVVDRAILSGKTLVQGDPRNLHKFKMSIIGAMAIVPMGWTFLEQKIDGNVEPFLKLDAYFSMLADQLVGNTSPPSMAGQGEAFRSPQAWALLASREEENKDARISRFLEQFVDVVQSMQRRICLSDTTEKDAKAAQKELLESMTRKELDELANQPVAETIRDLTPLERQMRVAIVAEKRGNPLYNQRALEIEDLSARADPEFLEKVLLPINDPTEEAEQIRLQLLEVVVLSGGQPVPVSPRDNHLIHLQTLMPTAQQMAQHITEGKFPTASLEAIIGHITAHYEAAQSEGAPKEVLKEIADFVNKAGPAIAQLKQMDAEAEQLAAQSEAADQEELALQQQEPLAPPELV